MCNTNNVQLPHELLHGHNVCTKQSRGNGGGILAEAGRRRCYTHMNHADFASLSYILREGDVRLEKAQFLLTISTVNQKVSPRLLFSKMALDDIDVSDKVLICGGGIGGLALGVALAKVQRWYPLIPTFSLSLRHFHLYATSCFEVVVCKLSVRPSQIFRTHAAGGHSSCGARAGRAAALGWCRH